MGRFKFFIVSGVKQKKFCYVTISPYLVLLRMRLQGTEFLLTSSSSLQQQCEASKYVSANIEDQRQIPYSLKRAISIVHQTHQAEAHRNESQGAGIVNYIRTSSRLDVFHLRTDFLRHPERSRERVHTRCEDLVISKSRCSSHQSCSRRFHPRCIRCHGLVSPSILCNKHTPLFHKKLLRLYITIR
jgi:hypothetical protein